MHAEPSKGKLILNNYILSYQSSQDMMLSHACKLYHTFATMITIYDVGYDLFFVSIFYSQTNNYSFVNCE